MKIKVIYEKGVTLGKRATPITVEVYGKQLRK